MSQVRPHVKRSKDAVLWLKGDATYLVALALVLGWVEENDLFVTNYAEDGGHLTDYLRGEPLPEVGEPPLLLAQEGKNPPRDLRVFCWRCAKASALQADGFEVRLTAVPELYRLEVTEE